MKFMNLKKKIAPVLMGGALAVATAVPVLQLMLVLAQVFLLLRQH